MSLEFELQMPEYGPQGLGDLRVSKTKDGRVSSIKIVAAGDDKIAAQTVFAIAPENVKPGVITESKKGIWFSLSLDETELFEIRPWDGLHPVKIKEFTRTEENADFPEPYVKRGRPGQKRLPNGKISKWPAPPDELRFTAVLEIMGGEFKGYTVKYWLPYIFERGEGNVAKVKTRSTKRLERLQEFLRLAGWDAQNEDIPFSENVLPFLESELVGRSDKNHMMMTVSGGWPEGLGRIGTGITY